MDVLDKIAEKQMREWLLEGFSDEYDQEQINELTFDQLVRAVNGYYDGGYKSFLASMLWMEVEA
jgi:hypothetical protein